MLIRVPHHFQRAPSLPTLQLGELTFVEYRTFRGVQQHEVLYADYALSFVLAGEKRLTWQQQEYRAPEGSGLFVQKGCHVVSEVIPGDRAYETLIFLFNQKLVRQFLTQHPDVLAGGPTQAAAPVVTFPLTPMLRQFAQSMLPYFHLAKTGHTEKLLRLKFQELLWLVLQADHSGQLQAELLAIARGPQLDLSTVLEQYAYQPVSVAELARLTGRSISAFKREFGRQYGTSPHMWLRDQRLERARLLLASGSHRGAEAGLAVGYENASHFIKAFKDKFGFTPKAWQRTSSGIF